MPYVGLYICSGQTLNQSQWLVTPSLSQPCLRDPKYIFEYINMLNFLYWFKSRICILDKAFYVYLLILQNSDFYHIWYFVFPKDYISTYFFYCSVMIVTLYKCVWNYSSPSIWNLVEIIYSWSSSTFLFNMFSMPHVTPLLL